MTFSAFVGVELMLCTRVLGDPLTYKEEEFRELEQSLLHVSVDGSVGWAYDANQINC